MVKVKQQGDDLEGIAHMHLDVFSPSKRVKIQLKLKDTHISIILHVATQSGSLVRGWGCE